MFELIIAAIANFIVGGLIGICGIAGFLLPMLYAGFLGMPVSVSLSLSFLAFFVSGGIGSFNYYKKGSLDLKCSIIISIGSFLGGLLGVKLNAYISTSQAKLLLYLVVLLSGISILLRKDSKTDSGTSSAQASRLLDSPVFLIVFGFITGSICSLSGAGGPVLVMPLLVSLGMNVRNAVGISLFDSIFIALPAFIGYVIQCDISQIGLLLAVTAAFHGAGVLIGSLNAHKIKQKPLKMGVAVFSIAIAGYMIITQLLG